MNNIFVENESVMLDFDLKINLLINFITTHIFFDLFESMTVDVKKK